MRDYGVFHLSAVHRVGDTYKSCFRVRLTSSSLLADACGCVSTKDDWSCWPEYLVDLQAARRSAPGSEESLKYERQFYRYWAKQKPLQLRWDKAFKVLSIEVAAMRTSLEAFLKAHPQQQHQQ